MREPLLPKNEERGLLEDIKLRLDKVDYNMNLVVVYALLNSILLFVISVNISLLRYDISNKPV